MCWKSGTLYIERTPVARVTVADQPGDRGKYSSSLIKLPKCPEDIDFEALSRNYNASVAR